MEKLVSGEAVSVFLSYSRSDLEMLNKLNKQLASLVRTHKIKTWHDCDIEAGSEWEPEIQNHLNTADIIILLISADFIASEYCYGNELKRAIERHTSGEARVIPVILKPCLWNLPEIPFSKLNVLPDYARPITKWEDPEEAFANVALHISSLVDGLRQRKVEQETKQQAEAAELDQQQAEQERIQQEQQRQAEEPNQQQVVGEGRRQQEPKQLLVQKNPLSVSQLALIVRENMEARAKELASEKGIKYAQLDTLLRQRHWKEADQETVDRMCEAMERSQEGWLKIEHIKKFPQTDLHTIDHLWVKHSEGKFGFSVQKKIWQACGSPTHSLDQWAKFGEAVGWMKKGFLGTSEWKEINELTFDTSAPTGHLPAALACGNVVRLGLWGLSRWHCNDWAFFFSCVQDL